MSDLEKLDEIKQEVERRKNSKYSSDPWSVLILIAEILILTAEQNKKKIELLETIKSNTCD